MQNTPMALERISKANTKPLALKETIDKCDYIKMKNFCHQRTVYLKEKKSEIIVKEDSVLQHLFQ